MSVVYVDSSALVRLAAGEPGADAVSALTLVTELALSDWQAALRAVEDHPC